MPLNPSIQHKIDALVADGEHVIETQSAIHPFRMLLFAILTSFGCFSLPTLTKRFTRLLPSQQGIAAYGTVGAGPDPSVIAPPNITLDPRWSIVSLGAASTQTVDMTSDENGLTITVPGDYIVSFLIILSNTGNGRCTVAADDAMGMAQCLFSTSTQPQSLTATMLFSELEEGAKLRIVARQDIITSVNVLEWSLTAFRVGRSTN